MTPRLLHVLACFLDRLSESITPVDVGECGPPECYSRREAKALGPCVAALAEADLITQADVTLSARPPSAGLWPDAWTAALPSIGSRPLA